MNIEITTEDNVSIAELKADSIVINDVQDALDILANAAYSGASSLIIHQHNLTPDFFDLKTKVAGEILQKFSTYNMPLAIVGDFSNFTSKSLHDFIYESNKGGKVNFVNTLEEAKQRLKRC
ncbi:DUF4180 domain-containing protein [Emticicia sp. 17c]|uniref:DUF4180 domain-containing protein n=1 Tax=Emticicia sp. 17c TaxID=3127704 RepID=UPI00301C33A6